jgi:hypothetical protein
MTTEITDEYYKKTLKKALENFEEFRRASRKHPRITKTLWTVKVNGELFVTRRGKFSWKQKGHAKNAFLQSLPCYDQKEVADRMIEEGLVEFIEVPIEEEGFLA